jgi:uncharacterized membrane protein YhaH (DUF805 family)
MTMTFLESAQVCVAKYADFSGQATRSEYWWFFLAVVVGSAAASTVDPALSALFSVAMVTPLLAVGARRLHETNRSGWWQLLALVPFGAIVVMILLALPGSAAPIRSNAAVASV